MELSVTQHQAAQADPDTVARLLAEVEALPEAQTQNLLADDQP